MDLIFGPVWYRLLVEHAPLDQAEVSGQVPRLPAGLAA
ncbi:TetR/AcrR family transcriptional regulator C-terminal ligand-binding domain-containing protein [Nocardia cyriacigeorgica]|nr:TetR/AcrR family transcriptional regulator C-terminal ligand-binding domain-containing protein [Nocardia cyriacigeorgica]